MKKTLAIILSICFVFCLTACSKDNTTSDVMSDNSQITSTENQTSDSTNSSDSTESSEPTETSSIVNAATNAQSALREEIVGTYRITMQDESAKYTVAIKFCADGTVEHRSDIDNDVMRGFWDVSDTNITFSLHHNEWEGYSNGKTEHYTAKKVEGGIELEGMFMEKFD